MAEEGEVRRTEAAEQEEEEEADEADEDETEEVELAEQPTMVGIAGIIDELFRGTPGREPAGYSWPYSSTPRVKPTILHASAKHGVLPLVKLLLDNTAQVNSQESKDDESPLILAARAGHVKMVRLLHQRNADLDFVDRSKKSAVMHAAAFGLLRVVRLLCESDADINLIDIRNTSALGLAARQKWPETARFLLDQRADVNVGIVDGRLEHYYQSAMALTEFCRHGYVDLIERALGMRADVNATIGSSNSLCVAAENEQWDLVRMLLANKASANLYFSHRDSPLMLAMRYRDKDLHKAWCRDSGLFRGSGETSDMQQIDSLVLQGQVEEERLQLVRLLLDGKASPDAQNTDNETPLIRAIVQRRLDMCELLLDRQANVDGRSVYEGQGSLNCECQDECTCSHYGSYAGGKTPLLVAAEQGYVQAAWLLLAHRADLDAADAGGTTALLAAFGNIQKSTEKYGCDRPRGTLHEYEEIARLLLEHMADINLVDRYGNSPIYFSLKGNRVDEAQTLLARRADGAAGQHEGTSILAMAAETKSWDLVRQLLEQRADVDPNGCDILDRSALMFAAKDGQEDIVCSLLQARAMPNVVSEFDGDCALDFAVRADSLAITQHLLAARASTNIRNKDEPILRVAIEKGNVDVVRVLIQRRADLNARGGWDEERPLAYAVERGALPIVQLLMQSRAALRGQTCLQPLRRRAATHGHAAVSKYLFGLRSQPKAVARR